jgi:DNA topoisomerase-3
MIGQKDHEAFKGLFLFFVIMRPKRKKQLGITKDALKGASLVVVATDSGCEGSLIGWEVLKHLGYKGKVARLHLEDLSEGGIKTALEKMKSDPASGDKDYSAYLEALARQEEDWLIGMNGSRAMTLSWRPDNVRGVLSYGGVQMPTLALLAEREDRIQNFISTLFYVVAVDVQFENALVTFEHKLDATKHRIEDKAIATCLAERAKEWAGGVDVVGAEKAVKPPKFFSGNSLAKKCAKLFGWRPSETEKVLQGLYDKGHATYPRTESTYLPNEHIEKAGTIMKAVTTAFPDVSGSIPDFLNCRKGSHYLAHTGEHHAIVPTDKAPDMSTLDAKENELYRLLARYYVAAHMEDCKEHHMTMTIEVAYSLFDKPKQIFSAKGKKTLEPGWKSLLKDEGEEPELPQVNAGEAGRAVDARVLDRKTEPPRRMSLGGLPEVMARLIELVTDPRQKKALENPVNPKEPKGLGTVASRKDVIETLLKRGYVQEKKGKGKDPLIEVTPLGLEVWKRLNKVYPDHASPVARAVFEGYLALIGKMNRVDAEKAFQHAQKRTREQVGRMVEAIKSHKEPFDVTLWQGTTPQIKSKGKKFFKSKRKKVA